MFNPLQSSACFGFCFFLLSLRGKDDIKGDKEAGRDSE